MESRCLRKTYLCQKGFKCNTCKLLDKRGSDMEVLAVNNQTMRVKCYDRRLVNRCINPKPVKGSEIEYIIPKCLFNMYILGLLNVEEKECEFQNGSEKQLYDHQVKDLSTKIDNPFILNANTMGYGKTVTALAYARHNNCKKILVVCPKSVLYHWKSTVEWYWQEMFDKTEIIPKVVKDKTQITIINYDMLIAGNRADMYKNFQWDCMILDEGHRIKNRKSKRAAIMKSIPCNRRIALTGTPVLRYLDDLFSLCEWLSPTIFGKGYWPFVEKFCKIEENFFGKAIVGASEDVETIKDLNDFMHTFMIRNDAIQIGQGIRHNVVKFELPPQVRRVYKLVQQQAVDELAEVMTLQNAMTKTIRLRQLVSNPGQFESEYSTTFSNLQKTHIKFQWIKDLLEDNPDIKIVVFSNFSTTIEALYEYLGSKICRTYIGRLSDTMREKHKHQFLTDDNIRVLAGTIGAMGESVDGLQCASHIEVFIDRDWSPEINRQAEGRLHRNGQEYVVECYQLEYDNTIEQKVGRVNLSKAEDVRRVLNA